MGEMRAPLPVKLFVGMLSSDPVLFEACARILQAEYGPVDYESGISSWEHTNYYAPEMGTGLLRKFIFFGRLIDPGDLAGIKLFTNKVEKQNAVQDPTGRKRRINLDPGYLTLAKVVLASTKDYSHRIFIGQNIYAEVTLQYKEKQFVALDHTYPDFRTEKTREMFTTARKKLHEALHDVTKAEKEASGS